MPTLRELSNLYAKKQPQQVDNITEEAPILDIIPFEESSHAYWNVYEETQDVTGASFVDMDEALPTISASTELKKVDLGIMGGKITVPEDKARAYGGMEVYFANKMPVIERQTGMNTEQHVLYNNFRQYAIDNSKVASAGGSGSELYSMIAVRFVAGETTGLYSPDGFAQGAMLNMSPINGGNLYEIDSDGVLGYGMRLKGYFGIQIANANTVAAIVNIDSSNVPGKDDIDQMLDKVRASNNTYLFMHRKVQTMLNTYKDSKLEMMPADENFRRRIMAWDGVPIITSYNFKDAAEAAVSV
jgi:hypothetical protein